MRSGSLHRVIRRVLPNTIYGQVVGILISSLFITLFLVAFLLRVLRPGTPSVPDGLWPHVVAIETAIRSIRAVPPAMRPQLAEGLSTPIFRFRMQEAFPCVSVPLDHETAILSKILVRDVASASRTIRVLKCRDPATDEESISITFPEDGLQAAIISKMEFHDYLHMTLPIIVPVLSLLVMMAALSIWSIWRVNRPLAILAEKAGTLGYDMMSPPLEEWGPREVRHVTRAFNRMQMRLAAAAAERTRMLMSISHDLRTPLTRLSMRVDMGGEDAAPEAMRNDVALMKQMLNGALAFLKGQRETEAFETVDLGSLLESLCEEFSTVGKDVAYDGVFPLACHCQPVSMARAVNNLIENGLKYGGWVRVNAWPEDGQAIIEVVDGGLGIPESMRAAMLEPFARMDQARSADGSLGLGLSIVHSIIIRHHGSITFGEANPHGLIVRLTFPRRLPHRGGRSSSP